MYINSKNILYNSNDTLYQNKTAELKHKAKVIY